MNTATCTFCGHDMTQIDQGGYCNALINHPAGAGVCTCRCRRLAEPVDFASGLPQSMSAADDWLVIVVSPWGEIAEFRDRGAAQLDRVFTTLGKPDVPFTMPEGQTEGGRIL